MTFFINKKTQGLLIQSGFFSLLCATLFFILASTTFALDVPKYQGYVNDYANMVSPQSKEKIERALQSFDLSDSTQVALLTIPSLEGDSLEDFSIRVVDQWGVGQKGKDNGVLLLIVKNDRKIRLEVGRGLEPVLTDLLSGRIIDTVITPLFKEGQFEKGIESGVAAIIAATRGEFKADPRVRKGRRRNEPSPLFKFLFFGVAIVAFLGQSSRKLGVAAGGLLFPLALLFGLSPFGLGALLFLVPLGAFGGWLLPLFLVSAMSNRGGRYYGGSGGFGGGGGGGSFGGFGGGSFGGGGASGGW